MFTAGHTFHEIFLHINWHCHRDQPQISPVVERFLHEFIQNYCSNAKGVRFEKVGGTETHIHLAIQVEPSVLVSDFIGKVKGASSYEINKQHGPNTLHWQRGYGVASFAKRNLPAVLKYIAEQKKHHQSGTTNEVLEEHGESPEEGLQGRSNS